MTERSHPASRRDFLKATGATLAGGALLSNVHAAGGDLLKVGLVGCGGRGTGAAAQALRADKNVKLVAMADAFADRLADSLNRLKDDAEIAAKIDVKDDHRFVGFDAYKQVIACCDVVLLATPPHFRPLHLKAAVEAGRHVFAEKPVAVDAPGVRSVLATCEEAKKKNLSVVSGLCLRYGNGFRETVRRVHDGAAGDVLALQANDFRGPIWVKPREQGQSDMEYQMRNWYYFTWLCGDFNVEQHVHFLDVCAWLMKDQYPAKACGTGGRAQRTGPEYGVIFDHHAVVYEYAGGAKLFSHCRQMQGTQGDISAHVMGTKGTASLTTRELSITTNGTKWKYDGPKNDHFQTEHDELFASIRNGKPINNGDYMAKTTLMAVMGRMATYTGKVITWDMALNSREDLTPPRYEWGPLPEAKIAVPGQTPFV